MCILIVCARIVILTILFNFIRPELAFLWGAIIDGDNLKEIKPFAMDFGTFHHKIATITVPAFIKFWYVLGSNV